MSEPDEGPSFDPLWEMMDPRWKKMTHSGLILRAIASVGNEIEGEGPKGGEGALVTTRAYFDAVIRGRIVARWCELTGFAPEEFPWTPDATARVWEQARGVRLDDKADSN